jgi:trigger factor
MRAGESRHLEVRYPDEYHNKALAGRVAQFDVQMRTVEEKHLPELDDEFCREYGVLEGGVAQLRSEVADNMRRELDENIKKRVKSQLLERLLAANPVKCRVRWSTRRSARCRWTRRRMGTGDASQLPAPEPFIEPARTRVALGLLIGEIIKTRGIKLDRQRVETKLAELAAGHPEPETLLKVYRQNADAMRQVENVVVEEQAVEDLLARANVSEQSSTFRDIMNFGA